MLGIGGYLWRLIPGNPILLRVVEAASKKRRDLIIRWGYLGLLVALVVWTLITSDTTSGDLAVLTKDSFILFKDMSYLQLGLVALLSPIFTAGAITQERDSQTYDILLSTPLSNGQIVLGSLFSRVFFVVALLISGIPVFSVTQIFGGIAIRSIVYSFLIAASTAMVTGAMAMAIATFKVGTRRTIFSFYLFIVIYLVGGFLLDQADFLHIHGTDAAGNAYVSQTSWLTGLHPFLALQVIFNDRNYLPPAAVDLPAHMQFWPLGWYWSSPATFYITFMTFLSFTMVLPSIIMLRRVAQTTTTLRSWVLQKLRLHSGDRRRKPRSVWNNPIAWREARTKASVARATILRWTFITAGMGGAVLLLILHSTDGSPRNFIDIGCYDAQRGTLLIEGQDKNDRPLAPNAQVKIGDQTVSWDELGNRHAVDNMQLDGRGQITQITLSDFPRELEAADVRKWLLGVVIVEVSVILLIITNAAASTVTREKEDGTLDLFLTTPITSRFYIWGKLRGLVSFVVPLLAVPVATAGLFIAHDLVRWLVLKDSEFLWVVLPESLLLMPAMLVVICGFAAILGMQMSLRCRTTVRAVMGSVGIIAGVCAALGGCGAAMFNSLSNGPDFAVGMGMFSPFTLLTILIDPYDFAGPAFDVHNPAQFDPSGARLFATVAAIAAVAAYSAGVWVTYKSMVRNFDMTIRRQSR